MSAPILPSAFASANSASNDLPLLGRNEMVGFVAGTRIATPMGYVAAERLSAGDLVLTVDGRHARIAWVGLTHVEAVSPETAPVRFAIGTLDNMRVLRVAQGHRLQIGGWRAELMFGVEAVLAPASAFVDGTDVVIEDACGPLTYVNLMFETHEVILAENIPCETSRPETDDGIRAEMLIDAALVQAHIARTQPSAKVTQLPVVSHAEARLLLAA